MNNEPTSTQSRYAKQWNYRPQQAIATSPVFLWPPQPKSVVRWFSARWLVIGENILITALAVLVWFAFQPVVAGLLHLLLHVKKSQGRQLKFDVREFIDKSKAHTFNHQLLDNMFWTLTSGVFFWTAYEALMLWAMANGYSPALHPAEHPFWFVALIFLTPIWISFHFYWAHRLLHWPPLYKLAHALHHRNTNVGPWSGMSMHPVEHLIWLSGVLIHWVVPAHPIHILFHMQHQAITAATSHAGFEKLVVNGQPTMALGTFHHQLHHRYFECNYGNLDIPWDKLFGSFHNGTEASHEEFLERRKRFKTNK